jgi:small neutral amino acid transporter SnatA (MarC family)
MSFDTYFIKSIGLLVMLLNPFLLIVYITDIVKSKSQKAFSGILLRAGIISSTIFILFALGGDFILTELLQARFGSLQIFGGVVLLIIGLQFVFRGKAAIEGLRGEAKHIAGAIAMPIMVGPGTISACMLVGNRLSALHSALVILISLAITITVMIVLKLVFDSLHHYNEKLFERYTEVAGRITALVVGTYAIDMIMQGFQNWNIL